ncbi:hypothetical protein A2526_01900 [candidate division WOR-1 bacterium RIFOXYD2_FULL_36_8]|nr:MAG: hypothetical protein A2526_01900 [candidate division WOR-1 bacterium RIFOXYD2_FULL_36_8]
MAVERILQNLLISSLKHKKKCNALVAEGNLDTHKIIFAEPQTYMNLSGEAVVSLMSWHKISSNHLIVIYDDVDLEPGQIRVRKGGGAGGHHGVESIMQHIGRGDFTRIRIGVGKGVTSGDVRAHVLGKIPPEQKAVFSDAVIRAAEAVSVLILNGLENAMNRFNG